jgi:hypothetical protein
MMYARLCNIEILQSYIKDVSMGDMLTIQAFITNPLDWHHFYEKVSTIRKGDRTDFTVVTREGDRIVGKGDVVEVEKWSNQGKYGFKLKLDVKRQKSLTDRRIRGPGRIPREQPPKPNEKMVAARPEAPRQVVAATTMTTITQKDMDEFKEMLKSSLTLDISR